MFFKPEIYFIDLDGTTLDLPKKSQKISDKNLNAINKCLNGGTLYGIYFSLNIFKEVSIWDTKIQK